MPRTLRRRKTILRAVALLANSVCARSSSVFKLVQSNLASIVSLAFTILILVPTDPLLPNEYSCLNNAQYSGGCFRKKPCRCEILQHLHAVPRARVISCVAFVYCNFQWPPHFPSLADFVYIWCSPHGCFLFRLALVA